MRRWLGRDGGQAVVEFALVLPLIAIFLLGMMQIGLALNTRQQLEGVARQGARTFALTGDRKVAVAAVQLAGRQIQIAQLGRTDIDIEVTTPEGTPRREPGHIYDFGGPLFSADIPLAQELSAVRGDWVSVRLTYRYPNPIQASVFGFRLPATIAFGTSATARIEFDPTRADR